MSISTAATRASRRLFVVSAEPSADLLTASLLPSLCRKGTFSLHGVYGPRTANAALRNSIQSTPTLFPAEDIAVMGVTALLPRLPTLALRASKLIRAASSLQPDLALFVDGKGLSRFAAPRIRSRTAGSTRIAQYVAPSVWAWKNGEKDVVRAKAVYDHLLLLFPFEANAWVAAGVSHTVVGSPVVEAFLGDAAAGIVPTVPRKMANSGLELVVMLGSRRAEIAQHGPLLGRTLAMLPKEILERIRLITVPVAAPHLREQVMTYVSQWKVMPHMPCVALAKSRAETRRALCSADAGVVTSGTATLEAALAGLPTVVIYKTDWLTGTIAKARAKVRYAGLPNLLADKEVMPEILFDRCTPAALVTELVRLLAWDPAIRSERSAAGRASVQDLLTSSAAELPSEKAASALAPYLFG